MAARKTPRTRSQKTIDKVEAALKVMEKGHTMAWAAQEVGIPQRTLWDALRSPAYRERCDRAQQLTAASYVQQAEEALTPKGDGRTLFPHQVTLRIARAKQKLWLAGKLDPRYSEKATLTHEGNPEKPVEHNVKMSPAEAYQRMLSGK